MSYENLGSKASSCYIQTGVKFMAYFNGTGLSVDMEFEYFLGSAADLPLAFEYLLISFCSSAAGNGHKAWSVMNNKHYKGIPTRVCND